MCSSQVSFRSIDSRVRAWSLQRALPMQTEYQDSEVRSFELSDDTGGRFQIWIEPPSEFEVTVCAWDFLSRRRCWRGSPEHIAGLLDQALFWVETLKASSRSPS